MYSHVHTCNTVYNLDSFHTKSIHVSVTELSPSPQPFRMSKRATTVVQSDVVIAATANGSLQHPSARTATESSSDAWINAIKLAGCATGGLVFGFAAEKGNGKFIAFINPQRIEVLP